MGLMAPFFTMMQTGKKRKGPSTKDQRAIAEHEAWLRVRGVHPDQLAATKRGTLRSSYKPSGPSTSDTIVDGGRAVGVMANLYKETPEVQRQVAARSASVDQLYNKGGYGVVVPSDGNQLGSRSRR